MNYTQNTNPQFWSNLHTECNCGSFALDVTSWFTPYDNNDDYTNEMRNALIQEMYDEGYSKDDILDTVLELDKAEILEECPWLEVISLEEAEPQDRVIAYRLYIDSDSLDCGELDDDYHFRVRINGFWFEKCGQDPIRFCGAAADEEPWETRYLVYDSDIIYFRFKKN